MAVCPSVCPFSGSDRRFRALQVSETARAAAAPAAGADHQLTDPGADLRYLAPDPDACVLITAASVPDHGRCPG